MEATEYKVDKSDWGPGEWQDEPDRVGKRAARPPPMNDALELGMLIVSRCRREGADARRAGTPYRDCPYAEELERAAWLDGWSRAAADKTIARTTHPDCPACQAGRLHAGDEYARYHPQAGQGFMK